MTKNHVLKNIFHSAMIILHDLKQWSEKFQSCPLDAKEVAGRAGGDHREVHKQEAAHANEDRQHPAWPSENTNTTPQPFPRIIQKKHRKQKTDSAAKNDFRLDQH